MRENKQQLLRGFSDDGFLLIDAIEGRIALGKPAARVRAIRASQQDLLSRLKCIGHNDFIAIPIKTTVQDGLSPGTKVRIGSRFITERIPFPSSGRQEQFRRSLGQVLQGLEHEGEYLPHGL
jgi:hypothetical protein